MNLRLAIWGLLGFMISALAYSDCTKQSCPIESRIKIAIIDTGVRSRLDLLPFLCKTGHQDFTNSSHGIEDTHGHGTTIAWLLTRNLDPQKYCILIYKFYQSNSWGHNNLANEIKSLRAAISERAKYINLSGGGQQPSVEEQMLFTEALEKGVHVAVAAGNHSMDLGKNCTYHPACLNTNSPNFYVVGNCRDGKYYESSNYGGPVKQCRDGLLQGPDNLKMSGTSQATAIFLNELIIKEGKPVNGTTH
jgi:hypothetical protein